MTTDDTVKMKIQHLFPIPVSMFEIGRELTQQELEYVNKLETRKNAGNETSVDSYVFNNPALAGIFEFAQQSLRAYFEFVYMPASDVGIRITQSWINFTKEGECHHPHSHDNSFISGVFYIQANEESDRILFSSPNRREIKIPVRAISDYNGGSWWLPSATGRLILFPSNLVHEVPPFSGAHTRISLSFNTYPVGMLGDEITLTQVKI